MALTSIIAIYFLFFAFSAFLLLPFGVKTHEEVGAERIPGPSRIGFSPYAAKRHARSCRT